MPISTFHGMQTSLRGLLAHQRAIDVTGNNIANADTEGYSRQEAVLAPSDPLRLPAFTGQGNAADLGTGVDAVAYRRMRDTFLDLQYRAQNMKLGEESAEARSLEQAELALGEPGEDGISALLNKFWSSWGDAANNPESQAARQAVVDQGKILASAFASLDGKLQDVATRTMSDYTGLTAAGGEVDQIARELATLNEAIRNSIAVKGQPNDLLDRRDLLLDRLSALGRVTVTALSSGSVQVQFGDAPALLVNDTAVAWPQAGLTPATGGRLGALLAVGQAGGTIDGYRAALNGVVGALATAVNNVHNPGGAGQNFFTVGVPAASTLGVAVNANKWPADALGLRTGTTGAVGANDIALAIGGLRGGASDSAYLGLVSRIGSDVREALRGETNAKVLVNAVNDRRQSAAGVSLDEEMTSLVRFQRGYQASARAMSTFDEMLDTLINRTGRVGL